MKDLQYLATGMNDSEPDVFSYSFAGKNGKFILPGSTATIRVSKLYILNQNPRFAHRRRSNNVIHSGARKNSQITDL